MRFQKTIKRIIALGTGATMMGATLMGAYAVADLANYPQPFIKDGKFSGVLVVGDKAAAEDVIGVSDIAISLQAAAVKKVSTTSGGGLAVEGDAWKVGTSAKMLEISEDLTTGGINREILSNITSFIGKDELKALASGEVVNNKATSPYNQYLYLLGGTGKSSMDTGYVQYTEDDLDVTADFLYFRSGREIGRYLLEFTTALETDVDDSTGAASATGLFLTDLQDIDITMLGKKYTVVTAKRTTTLGNNVVLTLMGGAKKDTLIEKGTKTYDIKGRPYEVTLNFVDADEAQFTINGIQTRKMKDGDTDRLFAGTKDDLTLGVTDILYQDYAAGIHSATFFIGAQKLELKDTDIRDLASTNAVKVDDNTIDDALVTIEGSDTNSTFKINRIHINMSADDNFFVPAGKKLSENSALDEPQVLFTNNWDIEYKGLSKPAVEKVAIRLSGSSQYILEFSDGDGKEVKLPIAKSPSGGSVIFGDTDKALINKENRTIAKENYIVLSDSGSSRKRGERKTYVLQYKGADKITNDNPVLKFKNLGSSETIQQTFSNKSVTSIIGPGGTAGTDVLTELATLKVGGSDYTVYAAGGIGANDFPILVDLDASGGINTGSSSNNFNSTPIVITTKNGLEINITNETGAPLDSSDVVFVSFRTPDETLDGSAKDSVQTLQASVMRFNLTAASAKVAMTQDTTTETNRINLRTPSGKTNIAYGYDSYGKYYTYETPTNDPATISLEVPDKQREALVYIAALGSTITESGVATGEAVTLQRIEVGATKLASEVTNIKGVNSILVGGPCANAAAATIANVAMTYPECAASFTPNTGMIKLYENNGNVAMLVAGYSASDTRNAAAVVANYKDYKSQLKGMNVDVKKVQGTTTVAAPVAATTTTTTTVAAPVVTTTTTTTVAR